MPKSAFIHLGVNVAHLAVSELVDIARFGEIYTQPTE